MPLIPQPDSFSMSPWHCSVAVNVDGTFQTAHVGVLRETHDLVLRNGIPYHYRERSDLWNWEAEVEFEHLYSGGLVVCHSMDKLDLCEADKLKLASLAINHGKVEIRRRSKVLVEWCMRAMGSLRSGDFIRV